MKKPIGKLLQLSPYRDRYIAEIQLSGSPTLIEGARLQIGSTVFEIEGTGSDNDPDRVGKGIVSVLLRCMADSPRAPVSIGTPQHTAFLLEADDGD